MVCSTAWKMKVELYTFHSFLLDENASQSNPWAAGMLGSSLATWPSFLTVGLRRGLTLRSWIYIKYILCTFYHFFLIITFFMFLLLKALKISQLCPALGSRLGLASFRQKYAVTWWEASYFSLSPLTLFICHSRLQKFQLKRPFVIDYFLFQFFKSLTRTHHDSVFAINVYAIYKTPAKHTMFY